MNTPAVRGELAGPLALSASVSVGNALGDHQASVLASVRAPFEMIHVNIGTGGQVSTPVKSFSRIAGIETRPWPGHRYLLTGAGLVGGRSLAWLLACFQEIGAQVFGVRRDEEELYETMLGSGAGELAAVGDFDPAATVKQFDGFVNQCYRTDL